MTHAPAQDPTCDRAAADVLPAAARSRAGVQRELVGGPAQLWL